MVFPAEGDKITVVLVVLKGDNSEYSSEDNQKQKGQKGDSHNDGPIATKNRVPAAHLSQSFIYFLQPLGSFLQIITQRISGFLFIHQYVLYFSRVWLIVLVMCLS